MNSPTAKNTTEFKVVLVGDSGVGKTSFLRKIKGCEFEKRYLSTIGCDVHPIFMKHSGSTSYTFWDTAGQETYSGKFISYFKGAHVVVLMYDISSKLSYTNLKKWYESVRSVNQTVPIILVGNKCDSDIRKVQNPDFHLEIGLPYFEISSKTGENIESALDYIIYLCK